MDIQNLKYPIGKLDKDQKYTVKNRKKWIKTIKKLPKRLKKVVTKLDDSQLNTPYRPEGWTVRQVVHHLADSHVNSYIRFRWTLTEDSPMIKAYDEKSWAELPDAKNSDIDASLLMLSAIHKRWGRLLESMSNEDFARELGHPEWDKSLSLNFMCSLYAWHCEHHLAHITELIKREGW
jgi:hypothetical protein